MSAPWIALFALQWLAVLTVLVLVLGLLRRIGPALAAAEEALVQPRQRQPMEGLRVGERVAIDASGRDLAELLVRGRHVLLFLKTGCHPCEALADELILNRTEVSLSRLVVVVPDLPESRELKLDNVVQVVRQRDDELARAFGTSITPHAFLVDEHGRVLANEIAPSFETLCQLSATVGSSNKERRDQRAAALIAG